MRLGLIVAILGAALVAAKPVQAAGSLGLKEVLMAVKTEPKLITEIESELTKAGLKAGAVVCTAARHGNHWTHLGGSRAAPYECEIGKRELTIDADRDYFDAKGKPLGDVDKADPKRAKTFRERNFRWQWN